jgi:hypothetical protein
VTKPVDRTRIDELRRLHAEATPGPWEGDTAGFCVRSEAEGWMGDIYTKRGEADVRLIAALRNNAGALLDAAEAGTKTREALLLVMDHVDYTAGACGLTEMVGAALPRDVLAIARRALAGIEVGRG